MKHYLTFLAAFLLTLITSPSTFAQDICPAGSELITEASRYHGSGRVDGALSTLLWLERGDAMWLRRNSESKHLKSRYVTIYTAYENGFHGYPKSKKTRKRIEKYTDANRDNGGTILPRPKNVPAAPPQSAIDHAEKTLNCRYDPKEAERNLTPDGRAEITKDREACPRNWIWGIKAMDPWESRARDTDFALADRQNKALAVLDWNRRGSNAFHLPDEDGRETFKLTKNKVANLFRSGDGTNLARDLETLSALESFSPSGPTPSSLEGPSDLTLYWAEDQLNCRYDPAGWAQIEKALEIKSEEDSRKEAFSDALEQGKKEAFLKDRGWFVPNASKAEPVGGVKETTNRNRYRGFSPDICEGYYGGLKEKPVLTAFERDWGNWFTHHYYYGNRCLYRPVERFYTAKEREMRAFQAAADRRQDQIAAEQRAYREKYGDNPPKSLSEMINDHVDRETEKSNTREKYKNCVQKYGEGNCVIVD